MKKDGHIHTHFCPHGTNDSFEQYIERAIELRFDEISFTEHAPLPAGFADTTPTKDSAITIEQLDDYFKKIEQLKRYYKNDIKINCGLEVDYIEGFETETKQFLNTYGHLLDDSILSVHFLKFNGEYDCVDYSPNLFEQMISKYGSIENIHNNYYRTVLKSVTSDLGKYKPKRIGHITLVNKFQKKFPLNKSFNSKIEEILQAIKTNNLELDYNGAGTAKPLCREPYPPTEIALKAKSYGIPLIYGSDAHQAKELGQGLEQVIIK